MSDKELPLAVEEAIKRAIADAEWRSARHAVILMWWFGFFHDQEVRLRHERTIQDLKTRLQDVNVLVNKLYADTARIQDIIAHLKKIR